MKRALWGCAVLLAVSACAGRKLYLEGTATAPAAVGRLQLDHDVNHTDVDLKVKQIDPAPRQGPGLTAYVVWVAPIFGGPFERGGTLAVGPRREGQVRFTTRLDRFRLIVTAERSPLAPRPSRTVVLQTVVDARH
ncbi:MAG TPA: hypothetical protein VGQ83_03250 [Polyangia bacterium]